MLFSKCKYELHTIKAMHVISPQAASNASESSSGCSAVEAQSIATAPPQIPWNRREDISCSGEVTYGALHTYPARLKQYR